jgi:hypothetical protein
MQRATYLIAGGTAAAVLGSLNPQAAAALVLVVGLVAIGLGLLVAMDASIDPRDYRPQAQRRRY